jgi:hypothetical protein
MKTLVARVGTLSALRIVDIHAAVSRKDRVTDESLYH